MARWIGRRLPAGVVAFVVGGLLTAAYRLTFLSTAQLQSTDFLFKAASEQRAQATVIVGIDQRSYRELLPEYGTLAEWPRTLYARAVDALVEAGARVIVFDLFFDTPRPEDESLVASIQRAGNVLMPVEAQGPRSPAAGPGDIQEFEAFVRPATTLRAAAAAEGVVNVTSDQDTVVRSLPLLLRSGGEHVPSLALTTAARYVRRSTIIDAPPTDRHVFAAGRAIPVVAGTRMLINFLGPPSSSPAGAPFLIVPFVDVVGGAFDRALVRDKIVLIGVTIRGIDEHTTPATSVTRMWGVEVLGNAVETVLGQRFLMPAPAEVTVSTTFALALVTAMLAAQLRPIVAGSAAAGLLALYLLGAMVAVDNGVLLSLVYPPAAIVLTFPAALAYRVLAEQAAQRALRDVMARYLSPTVSAWVLQDPERLRLGGETRVMTVLFSDIRGFTTLSHTMAPQALVTLLNEHMTAMTEIIFAHDGVLDKYIGDAVMAFWNAPMEQPDHAQRACATALDMLCKLAELQADWAHRGVPNLDIGIGINTGPMVVGNMGAHRRLAYTVLGDAVNVASRLEKLNKEYGTRVIVGEHTRAAAGDAFGYRLLDVVAVTGREAPLAAYELVGPSGVCQMTPVSLGTPVDATD